MSWQTMRLGDVLQLEYGKPLPDDERDPSGRYVVYGANGEKARSNRYLHGKPSIVVGRKGSAGEIKLTEDKFWPLDVTYFVTFDETRYDVKFLYYLLDTLNLPSMARGVKPGINRNDVYSLNVSVAALPEQRRIAALLDKGSASIATAKAIGEKSLRLAREVFETHLQGAFSERGGAWRTTALGEVADFRNGINFTKSSKGRKVRVLGVRDFKDRFHAPDVGLDRVTIDGELEASDFLQSGDIVFVRSNGNPELIGRSLVIEAMSEETAHSGFTIRARLHDKNILPNYLGHFLKSSAVRRQMVDGGTGTNIKSLNQGTLSRLIIPYPPRAEQQTIVTRLEELQAETRRLESLYTRKIAALDELKGSLLQRALSGQH